MSTQSMQALVNRDKTQFIIAKNAGNQSYILSFFNIKDNLTKPSLIVNVNRYLRCRALLSTVPSAITMHSDGDLISIDAVHKLLDITPDKDGNLNGIILYSLNDSNEAEKIIALYTEKTEIPTYLIVKENDETKYRPTTLKVFPTIFEQGGIICIADSVEKILQTSYADPTTGLLGITDSLDFKRIIMIQQFWPELEIYFTVEGNLLKVYSNILKDKFTPGFLYIHKNFGGCDISVLQTHEIVNPEVCLGTNVENNGVICVKTNGTDIAVFYCDNILDLDDYTTESLYIFSTKQNVFSYIEDLNKKYKPKHGIHIIDEV